MKCKSKLCQRSKNLNTRGNCEVCEEVIKETEKKHEKVKEKLSKNTVEVDIKHMISTHKKLMKGENVDSVAVSNLVLGGVINILAQHDAIEEIQGKVNLVQHELITNQNRIESLENWVLRQDVTIKELEDKLDCFDKNGIILKESKAVTGLTKRIVSLEIDIDNVKKCPKPQIPSQMTSSRSKKCGECGESFSKNCELEIHIENVHGKEKEHECETCGKTFHLKWRLKKHRLMHSNNPVYCHYYNNGGNCQYQEIGCMFLHELAGPCKLKNCARTLCQYDHRHIEANEAAVELVGDEHGETNDDDYKETVYDEHKETAGGEHEETVEENQCHFCMDKFDDSEELFKHFEDAHNQFYTNMMKTIEDNLSKPE